LVKVASQSAYYKLTIPISRHEYLHLSPRMDKNRTTIKHRTVVSLHYMTAVDCFVPWQTTEKN